MAILYIVSTPIGNLKDITLRALEILFKVNIIACEDTRKTGQLLNHYRKKDLVFLKSGRLLEKPKPKLISYYEENEGQRIPEIIEYLKSGKNAALVTNAGTPTIADPGFKLVRQCIKENIKVVPVPGASAVLSALVVSGLPINKFIFLGFLPKKRIKRKKLLVQYQSSLKDFKQPITLIINESPHRLIKTLQDIQEIFKEVEIVITSELTKIHEKVWRGKISEAVKEFKNPKGEFTFLFSLNF